MKPVNVLIAAVAAIVVGAIGYTVAPDSNVNVVNNVPTPVVEQNLGATPGGDFYNRVVAHDGMIIGGGYVSTTSAGTATTYLASTLASNRVILHIASQALTATLPTAANMKSAGLLLNPGDTYSLMIHASTSAITIAGNTGLNLQTASTSAVIRSGNTGRLEFTRLGATEDGDIDVLLISD